MATRLRWTDAWLLAAITDGQTKDEPVNLAEMIESADWLNRGIPGFHDVSYGLQRLVAAGWVTVEHPPQGGVLMRATAAAVKIKRARVADYRRRRRLGLMLPSLGSVIESYAQAIGAVPDDGARRSFAGSVARPRTSRSDKSAPRLCRLVLVTSH